MKNPLGLQAFGIHLRRLREAQNLSQQQLANLADVDKKTIQRIENAKFRVTLDVIISLSIGLDLPLKDLIDFTIPKEKKK